jgi:tRNA nucleotidyltransferase (CCA-adding enzyme)
MAGGDWSTLLTKTVNPGLALRALRDRHRLPPDVQALVGVPQDPTHHPEGDAFEHTCHVVDAMADILSREGIHGTDREVLMLAALTHDLGKATTTKWNHEKGKWTAYGHELASVPLTRRTLDYMGVDPARFQLVAPLVRHHMAHCRKDFSVKAVRKLARELQPMTVEDLLLVLEADCAGRPPLPPGLPPVVTDQLVPVAKANFWFDGPHPADRLPSGVLSW